MERNRNTCVLFGYANRFSLPGMFEVIIHPARPLSHDDPVWEPLEALLPLPLCGRFMWMQAHLADDVGAVQAYKHRDTRRYLHLDREGRPYENLAVGFRRMRRLDAIEQVFGLWWCLQGASDADRRMLANLLGPLSEADVADEVAGVDMPPCSPAAALRYIPGPEMPTPGSSRTSP